MWFSVFGEVIIWSLSRNFYIPCSYVESVQVDFRKFVHLSQLIVLRFDVEQKPHTLNIQILLLRRKCMQFIIGTKITLHWSHADSDTLRQIYPLLYTRIFSSSMVIPICGVNNFNIELETTFTFQVEVMFGFRFLTFCAFFLLFRFFWLFSTFLTFCYFLTFFKKNSTFFNFCDYVTFLTFCDFLWVFFTFCDFFTFFSLFLLFWDFWLFWLFLTFVTFLRFLRFFLLFLLFFTFCLLSSSFLSSTVISFITPSSGGSPGPV